MTDGIWISLITAGVTAFFLLGVPIFLVIGLWVVGTSLVIDFTLANVGVTLFQGLSFFGLLALPLFILTGDLINAAGIAKRLSDFAYSTLSWMRGGMGMSTLGACGLFAAISGSNAGTTATIGSIMQPEMVKNGYDERFAAATAASGGTVGIIIPPSIIFIVYGFMMNLSISDLFIAGMVPGALMVVAMMGACYLVARKNGWGQLQPFKAGVSARLARKAYLGFATIGVVVYGIYSGKFSPTEAAAITVGFTMIAGLLITREISLRKLPTIMLRSGQIAGMLAPLIAISVVMQQLLSVLGAGQALSEMLSGIDNYYLTLGTCMLIILLAGMILESLPVTIILAPILAPIAQQAGVDPIHFSVIFLVGAAIGFVTPPFGLNLYVASSITGISYVRLVKYVIPYFIALIACWLAICLVPSLSLFLVNL
ncbi:MULTISPECIES: TRAP transporter large permease [Cobetia]|uniref:TRAP transporter large permease protein n=1 Tax=Cobetia amphilecti TaxID=1055104 RepID=A0AAP4TYV8_9GAMM|nr:MULTISPECIES: TRAP transporter large permease [Cobetia]AVV34933.1 TRAP transporter large permease [Halomonas sp. SF2003]MBR9755657.1 TRAP transporter large permease [Gammaproteobacteria bacterium]TCJ26762.1 TRAP transporter large permease [Halomonas sp. GDM18]UTV86388.1 TRAP transporter large permease [Cobetia litoralis]KPM80914.1 TRAP transporter [Cobetia sp. UCD-24C]|tara:strand:- start:363 stop:1640 length:1278 start_codon:yes stop_codon:yes gene_type:complete